MDPVIKHLAQATVFLTMLVVGLELTRHDFARVLERPRLILLATLAQILLLPALGLLLAGLLQPPQAVALGIVLLAACPGGVFSNLYTTLVRGDVALSVTLTALSTVLAALYLPLLLPPLVAFLGHAASGAEISRVGILLRLLGAVALPVGLGMLLRAALPERVERWRPFLRGLSLVVLVALLGRAFVESGGLLGDVAGPAAVMAAAFTMGALLTGLLVGVAVSRRPAARATIGIEFAVRNIPVAVVVASTILPDARLVAFGATYFVVHAPLTLAAGALMMGLARRRAVPARRGRERRGREQPWSTRHDGGR